MTPEQEGQLQAINVQVNAIPYNETPGKGEPPDWWSDEPVAGNSWVCRDYTLMKADKLKALGWQASELTEVFCWVEPEGNPPVRGYHAVLAVSLDGECWILDSRFDPIYKPSDPSADYLWDKQQIVGTTDFRSLEGGLPV
jgi:predicted transglutaminase-like cysteine proteinase